MKDVRLASTQTPAVSEHFNKTGHCPDWNNIKCLERDSHKVTEAIQIRLHPNNIQ